MRKQVKAQVTDLLDTMQEALVYISRGNAGWENLLYDCEKAFAEAENSFRCAKEDEHTALVRLLKIRDDFIADCNKAESFQDIKECTLRTSERIEQLKTFIAESISDKMEILFIPYQHSMWDCMESVWKAAEESDEIDARVMPIPYFERNSDRSLGKKHDETEFYDMPLVDYRTYKVEEEKPDVVIYHNPYDSCNYVTSIAPEFYSDILKNHTKLMVYMPYSLSGYTGNINNLGVCRSPGVKNANLVILQSENLKKAYMASGVPEDKLAVLGSPKIDAVINEDCENKIPREWREGIKGRKTILYNTSISTFLNDEQWFEKMERFLECVSRHKDIFVIWRPHPLLEATVSSMRADKKERYSKMKKKIEDMENLMIDMSKDVMPAIWISDAMISDYSSLIPQYVFTEKPVLCLFKKPKRENLMIYCDYLSSYFVEDDKSVENFIEMVLNGEDPGKEERLKNARQSVCNPDGTCGKRIIKYITNLI